MTESVKGDVHNGNPEEARFDSMACLDYAKRLGKYAGEDRPRPILARFKCADDKFNLFRNMDKSRSNGIRITNDLTFQEMQQLEDLKRDRRHFTSRRATWSLLAIRKMGAMEDLSHRGFSGEPIVVWMTIVTSPWTQPRLPTLISGMVKAHYLTILS